MSVSVCQKMSLAYLISSQKKLRKIRNFLFDEIFESGIVFLTMKMCISKPDATFLLRKITFDFESFFESKTESNILFLCVDCNHATYCARDSTKQNISQK